MSEELFMPYFLIPTKYAQNIFMKIGQTVLEEFDNKHRETRFLYVYYIIYYTIIPSIILMFGPMYCYNPEQFYYVVAQKSRSYSPMNNTKWGNKILES